jgi:hypothetical protein
MTVQTQRLFWRKPTNDHNSSYSKRSVGSAGSKVAFSTGCCWTFFEPAGERAARNPKNPGNATHARAFPVGRQNPRFIRFGIADFRLEHGRFAEGFALKLLLAVAILTILDQGGTPAPMTCISNFFVYHLYILLQTI